VSGATPAPEVEPDHDSDDDSDDAEDHEESGAVYDQSADELFDPDRYASVVVASGTVAVLAGVPGNAMAAARPANAARLPAAVIRRARRAGWGRRARELGSVMGSSSWPKRTDLRAPG
jgi:hypothetical protein